MAEDTALTHPENIEIERFDFDGAFVVVAKCPHCGAFENAYGIDSDATTEVARLAVQSLAERPCNVHYRNDPRTSA